MELDWETESVGGITLVSVRLTNERAVDRRVRLRNRLDGPVLPPRRQREPEAGWDRDGLTVIVPSERTVARGYACPAPNREPPVEIAAVSAPAEMTGTGEVVKDVIRDLGDARPPRAVLGEDPVFGGREPRKRDQSRQNSGQPGSVKDRGSGPIEGTDQAESAPKAALPPDFEDGLAPCRRRIETVEALGLASVSEATTLLDTNGGVVGVERLGKQLDDDAAALRTLAIEATALAVRARTATPPVDALRRLM